MYIYYFILYIQVGIKVLKNAKKLLSVAVIGSIIGVGVLFPISSSSVVKACSAPGYGHLYPYPGYVLTTALSGTYDTNVRDIQIWLHNFSLPNEANDREYNPGDMDGYYGSNTARAVRHYQAKHGLTQDGKVESATWNSMRDHGLK